MNNDTKEKLKALQDSYAKKLPEKILNLDHRWKLIGTDFNKQAFIDFHREVHSLGGSTGTYGYAKLSKSIRDLDIYLRQLLGNNKIDPTQFSEVSHLLNKIIDDSNVNTNLIVEPLDTYQKSIDSKLIFIINQDPIFSHELKNNLKQIGYDLQCFTSISDKEIISFNQLPAAIIIDGFFLDDPKIDFIKRLRDSCNIPLLCIADHNDLPVRLKAIRTGVTMFIRKPVEINYLTKLVNQLCNLHAKSNYRILVLDDSAPLAEYYAIVLQEAGMIVRAITDPLKLLQELDEFRPDLLLMDLYMPGYTGIELATILRQEEHYLSLPIIFVSTEDDRFKQFAMLNSGDIFLTKPILAQHLVSAVKSRAKRSAVLLSYITHDSLTRVLNHTYILQQLDIEIINAQRLKQTVSFAMIDIDHFKQVNDKYGHPVGDLVLIKTAEFLSSNLRITDYVGRYGGEEFAIIFPDTSLEVAIKLCNELREKFSAYQFEANSTHFNLTFSIGLACYPMISIVNELVASADNGLYKAKEEGRNRLACL